MASRRHPVLASVGALLALVALLGCAARLLPEDMQALPYVPYVIALSPWFALAAMVSLVCACIAHRWFTAAVAVACIVLQGYWQLPFYRNGEPLGAQAIAAVAQAKPAIDDAFARVMTCNVYKGAADPQAIVDAVRDQHVEVLALQETTPQFVQRLEQAGIGDYLPYAVSASSGSGYGNGLWSAQPLQQPADAEFPSSASAMPAGTIRFDNGALPVRLSLIHI